MFNSAYAQRFTDKLNRGLVAVQTSEKNGNKTVFLSWRRFAEEYYNVKYNLYYNNSLIAGNLEKCNYTYNTTDISSEFKVVPVVNGTEDTSVATSVTCSPSVWKNASGGYIDITLGTVQDRDGNDVTSHYFPNDAEMADLDGDGDLEVIIKRINEYDAADKWGETPKTLYDVNSKEFTVIEAYDVNWQTGAATRMWWIDCGPNMVSMNSTEINIIAYDWDEDGKAEVVLRGADDMRIHNSNSTVYQVGTTTNYRNDFDHAHGMQYAWTHTGPEYLLYLNGQTGELYQKIDFPLPRFEADEAGKTEQQVWSPTNGNGGYGHRSSKYFFGAPFLDGKKASLFLGRGIYTQTKMIAMDLNRSNHTWSQTWRWKCNTVGSPWFGQGNHNMTIADVDLDGCDEIVYGSMVIDHTGRGLSTTGYGHGDALHVSKFNPYRKGGLEAFACNEDEPSNNYRDATTSQLFFREEAHYDNLGKLIDDGRCLMGNFTDNIPGSQGRSVESGVISSVTNSVIPGLNPNSYIYWSDLNFRIYWDGDLCDEILNSPGTAKEAKIEKPGYGRLFTSVGCNMNNDSKNNPCFQGDVLGDWREEILVRCGQNLRLYTTVTPSDYGIYTLWHDHQYRQAMVWQMCAYNQPPHKSYFLGAHEGMTVAPPPLTTRGREVVSSGSFGTSKNGKHVLITPDNNNVTIKYDGRVSPSVLTVNVPSIVTGNDNNSNITTTPWKCTLGNTNKDDGIEGATTRFVKQGEGLLVISKKTLSYGGDTDIWGGSVQFNGTLSNSKVNMKPHTTLYTYGTFTNGITMDYGSALYLTDGTLASSYDIKTATIGTLTMKEGARVVLDINATSGEYDQLNLTNLVVSKRSWEYGPEYCQPVFQFRVQGILPKGELIKIGTLTTEVANLDDILIEGINSGYPSLQQKNGELYLLVNESTPESVDYQTTQETAWTLDFEEASDNNYGFSAQADITQKGCMQQASNSDGSHCFHIYGGSLSGNRSTTLQIPTTNAKEYKFEFDAAGISGNLNTTTMTVKDRSSRTIFSMSYAVSTSIAFLYNADGDCLGMVDITPMESGVNNNTSYVPNIFNHFIVEGDASGVRLTVKKGNEVLYQNIKLCDDFVEVGSVVSDIARGYAHIAYDNFKLTTYPVTSLTLSDTKVMTYPLNEYPVVNFDRNLVRGYNTICVPFNVSKTTLVGESSKVYELTSVGNVNDEVVLNFTPVEQLTANKPYIVYATSSMKLNSLENVTPVAATSSNYTVDGWTFVSNYEPHYLAVGKYIIGTDQNLDFCGPRAYINGMRGYLTGPAPDGARIRCVFGDEDVVDGISEVGTNGAAGRTIYGIDGKRQSAVSSGINIIRQANGKTIKVIK